MNETTSDWASAAQSWGTLLVDRWSAATYQPPQAPAGTTSQARAPGGALYTEGQPVTRGIAGALGVSPLVLFAGVAALLGAALLFSRMGK